MTNWSREYSVRLFGWNGHPFNPAILCVEEGCDVEIAVGWPAQDGPYTVSIKHNGVVSGEVTEDTYRESFALDELFAEWIENEHEMACICGDGGVAWCPGHGTLWYDQDGRQYRVEVDGWPEPPRRAHSTQELIESGVWV